MTKIKRFFALALCSFLFCACAKQNGWSVDDVLSKNPNLQKVLDHCAGDSLKTEAAEFLIRNLPYHFSYEGDALVAYKALFELHSKNTLWPEEVLDSITRQYGGFHLETLVPKSDIYIDPDYLIDNIDWAFRVWREQPWGRCVSFHDFCEYILPYRVENETLEPWREWIYDKFNPLMDSIRQSPQATDLKAVSAELMKILTEAGPKNFTGIYPPGPHYGPKSVLWRSGSCANLTYMQLFVFRALGVPCTEEIMLIRGARNSAHYWNGVFDNDGNTYRCSILDPTPELKETVGFWDQKCKVYRRTFSVNWDMINEMNVSTRERYPSFRFPKFVDVTTVYSGPDNTTLAIEPSQFTEEPEDGELVYLCLPRFLDWEPITFTHYDKNSGAVFENLEGDVVLTVATYRGGVLRPVTTPLSLDRPTTKVRFFATSGEKQETPFFYKYELFYDDFLKRMVGGVFEGSNSPDFHNADTLYVIKDNPMRLLFTTYVHSDKKYRYLRYRGPEDGYCNVSEVRFYEADKLLIGKVIGTAEAQTDFTHDFTKAFDGDPYTSFDYPEPTGGWAGLDLGAAHQVNKIVFTPRNRDNYVRPGDEYELFYYAPHGWQSLGRQYPQADSVLYAVPQGALLYLKNHTRGNDERVFEYVDGKQRFW